MGCCFTSKNSFIKVQSSYAVIDLFVFREADINANRCEIEVATCWSADRWKNDNSSIFFKSVYAAFTTDTLKILWKEFIQRRINIPLDSVHLYL